MWPELQTLVRSFPSAVLNARDADGYPLSARTAIALDDGSQLIGVQLPEGLGAQAGPASLLFHSHNEQLWDLRIHLVRGELILGPGGARFRPLKLVPSAESGLGAVRMIINCRRAARAYLARRGLARPAIPWQRLRDLKAQALKG